MEPLDFGNLAEQRRNSIFRDILSDTHLQSCFTCGTCSGGCPLTGMESSMDEDLDARKVIRIHGDSGLYSGGPAPLPRSAHHPGVWISPSVNAVKTWELFERNTPPPDERLAAARRLKAAGWRIKIRIDPVIPEVGVGHYREVARKVSALAPERVTLGLLKHFPRLPRGPREGTWRQLAGSPNGIQRYPLPLKARIVAAWRNGWDCNPPSAGRRLTFGRHGAGKPMVAIARFRMTRG